MDEDSKDNIFFNQSNNEFDLIHIPESIWQVGNKYFLVYNVFENVFEWIILFTVFFCSYQCIYESNICVIAYDHDYDSDVKIRL